MNDDRCDGSSAGHRADSIDYLLEVGVSALRKSKNFVYRIPWRGDPVPTESHAKAVFNGEEAIDGPEPLDPYTWLEIEQRQSVELFESTLAIPRQSQVLSLVWVVAEGSWV